MYYEQLKSLVGQDVSVRVEMDCLTVWMYGNLEYTEADRKFHIVNGKTSMIGFTAGAVEEVHGTSILI